MKIRKVTSIISAEDKNLSQISQLLMEKKKLNSRMLELQTTVVRLKLHLKKNVVKTSRKLKLFLYLNLSQPYFARTQDVSW